MESSDEPRTTGTTTSMWSSRRVHGAWERYGLHCAVLRRTAHPGPSPPEQDRTVPTTTPTLAPTPKYQPNHRSVASAVLQLPDPTKLQIVEAQRTRGGKLRGNTCPNKGGRRSYGRTIAHAPRRPLRRRQHGAESPQTPNPARTPPRPCRTGGAVSSWQDRGWSAQIRSWPMQTRALHDDQPAPNRIQSRESKGNSLV